MDLKQLSEKLKTYCKINQKDYDEFVEERNLLQMFSVSTPQKNLSQAVFRIMQKIRNEIIMLCMVELKSICDDLNIPYAFMKGLPLAEDLYAPREARNFADIDILVSIDDVHVFLDELGRHDYVDKNGFPPSFNQAIKRIYTGHHHLNAIYKSYSLNGKSENIAIEIHVSPNAGGFRFFGEIDNDFSYTSTLLARTKTCSIDGIRFQVPNVTDTLYTLALHLSAHACLDVILYLYLGKPFTFPSVARMTVDIALHLRKYSAEIDWDELNVISEKYGTKEILDLVFYIINDLYGNELIPQNILTISETQLNAYCEVCRIMRKIPPSEYIVHSNLKIYIDKFVKENACLRGDSIPPWAVLTRKSESIQINIPINRTNVQYCLDIYNTDLNINKICGEYIIRNSSTGVEVLRDNGYMHYWDPEMCKKYGANDILLCYDPVCVDVTYDSNYVCIEIEDDSIGFRSGNSSICLLEIEKVNPLSSKFFCTDKQVK